MTVIPDYHNVEQVKIAVAKQEGLIRTAEAQVQIQESILKSIRMMCPHEYTTRYSMGHDAGRKCDICGGWA